MSQGRGDRAETCTEGRDWTADRDRRINALAAQQHGVVARRQLTGLGLQRETIAVRIRHGWLRPLHRGVYAVGDRKLDHPGRCLAAVLAAGGRSGRELGAGEHSAVIASHLAAAALHGMLESRDRDAIDVTAVAGHRPRPGIRAHRSRTLDGIAVVRAGIPCTSVERTLVDIAGTGSARLFERAWSRTASGGRIRAGALERELDSAPTRSGTARVREALVADHAYLAQTTRSGFERRVLLALRDAGVPRPAANRWVQLDDGTGFEVDLVWPAQRVAIEIDGEAVHAHPTAKRRDGERDRALGRAGWRTLRIGEREFADDPARAVARVRRALVGR